MRLIAGWQGFGPALRGGLLMPPRAQRACTRVRLIVGVVAGKGSAVPSLSWI